MSLLLFIAALKIAGPPIGMLIDLPPEHLFYAAAGLMAMAALPGGMRSLTWTQTIQFLVVALACVAPMVFLALTPTTTPAVPSSQALADVTFGKLPELNELFMTQPLPPVLLAALGTASLPHLLAGSLASRSEREAGTAMGWAVVLSMLLAAIGLMLASALPAAIDSGMPDLPRLLSPLSAVLTGLVVAGGLASLFALGQAALLSAAATLSHDLYDEVLDRRGPEGRRIFVARIIVVGVAASGAAMAFRWQIAAPDLLQWSLALAAGGFAPLVIGLWWRRCNEIGAIGGMVAGFGFTGLIFAMAQNIIPTALVASDWAEVGAPAAALVGVLFSAAVTIGLSLATPAPESNGRSPNGGQPIRERPA